MARLPDIDPKDYTPEQKTVADAITAGPRGEVRGPFKPLMHNPKAADVVQQLGSYLRFNGKIEGRLRELAIIITGRVWTAQYEWYAHASIAEKEGLDTAIIDAIAAKKRPAFKNKDEEVVYNFVTELHETHNVSDGSYKAAQDLFGNEGVIELIMLCGHYTIISMVLNTFEIEVPGGLKPLKD